jgi:hypothetical protein
MDHTLQDASLLTEKTFPVTKFSNQSLILEEGLRMYIHCVAYNMSFANIGPLRNRCKCMFSLLVLTGCDFIELQRCCLLHSSSHEIDGPKYLKYDQVVSVHDTAITLQEHGVGGQSKQTRRTVQANKLRRNFSDPFSSVRL